MKKQLLTFAVLGVVASAFMTAQDDTTAKIIIAGESSPLGSMPISTTSSISFADGQMIVSNGEEQQKFNLTDISAITFDLSMDAAETIEADLSDSVKVNFDGGILTVTVPQGDPVTVTVYSLNGSQVAATTGISSATINLNTLSKGIYVIRANNKVIKFTR